MKLEDIAKSPSCSISVMRKEFGLMKVQAFVGKMIIDVAMFFNVGKMINEIQVASVANLIIEEYYYLKPDDFKLCFNRAKKGKYGKIYDRIDGQIIFDWLNTYVEERIMFFEDKGNLNHDKHKHGKDINNTIDELYTTCPEHLNIFKKIKK